jgi:hypothetical protein
MSFIGQKSSFLFAKKMLLKESIVNLEKNKFVRQTYNNMIILLQIFSTEYFYNEIPRILEWTFVKYRYRISCLEV